MLDNIREECGIVAVYQLNFANAQHQVNVASYIPNLLLDLQHRGQLSAGMSSYYADRGRLIKTHRDLGLVERVFALHSQKKSHALLEEHAGTVAIGHVRYATCGEEDNVQFAQPFERIHGNKWKWFSIAFNGNLANFQILKEGLIDHGYHITYDTDTEIIMHYINRELRGDTQISFAQLCASLANSFDGAYCILFLNAKGEMFAMRDPLGIKPLCYGVKDDLLLVASESVALTRLGIVQYQDLDPGCVLIAKPHQGYSIERYTSEKKKAFCHFEWVYFSNIASVLNNRSVFKTRRLIGRLLAESEDLEKTPDDRIVPVPETANIIGSAYGFKRQIPVIEGLIRNRYVGRTFIEGSTRQEAVMRKFLPIPQLLAGKRIFLVDDSLVRSTTLINLVQILRTYARVKEIHVRIACPPIISPCFYGINFPTSKELFATKFQRTEQGDFSKETLVEMAKALEVDSLSFLSIDSLTKAIGHRKHNICLACLNSEYPTPFGFKNYQQQL